MRIVPPRADGGDRQVTDARTPDLFGQHRADMAPDEVHTAPRRIDRSGLVDVELVEMERRPVDPCQRPAGERRPPWKPASRSCPENGLDGQCRTACS